MGRVVGIPLRAQPVKGECGILPGMRIDQYHACATLHVENMFHLNLEITKVHHRVSTDAVSTMLQQSLNQ